LVITQQAKNGRLGSTKKQSAYRLLKLSGIIGEQEQAGKFLRLERRAF
jgi:hypothetical protein